MLTNRFLKSLCPYLEGRIEDNQTKCYMTSDNCIAEYSMHELKIKSTYFQPAQIFKCPAHNLSRDLAEQIKKLYDGKRRNKEITIEAKTA